VSALLAELGFELRRRVEDAVDVGRAQIGGTQQVAAA
jgi:hypothetical protein